MKFPKLTPKQRSRVGLWMVTVAFALPFVLYARRLPGMPLYHVEEPQWEALLLLPLVGLLMGIGSNLYFSDRKPH